MNLSAAICHDKPVQITAYIWRLTAPNPGMMTGRGTNTFIVGDMSDEKGELYIVDPGPLIKSHIAKLIDFTADRLKGVLVSHTHNDHSPAAAVIAEQTGVPTFGMMPAEQARQDLSFVATQELVDGDSVPFKGGEIKVIHTPGHVENHLCFLVEPDKVLLAGDHLLEGGTVVIIPPHGSMRCYMQSLEKLDTESIASIGPAHGMMIDDANAEIQRVLSHRAQREQKVIEKLAEFTSGASLHDLVVKAYDDVDPTLHRIAKLSLEAHLIKLFEEQRAEVEAGVWTLRN